MILDLILIGINLLYIVFIVKVLDILEKYVSNEAVRYYIISVMTIIFYLLLVFLEI